jgi:hypothetical protein
VTMATNVDTPLRRLRSSDRGRCEAGALEFRKIERLRVVRSEPPEIPDPTAL